MWHWYYVYREHVEKYVDTPYTHLLEYKPRPKQEVMRMKYEGVQGVKKPEWMRNEESRNKRIRTKCKKIATIRRQKLTHPNQWCALCAHTGVRK